MATQIYLGKPPAKIVEWIEKNYVKPEVDMTKVPLTFTAEEAGAKLSLKSYNGDLIITLETSPTGEEGSWQPYTVGNDIVLENVGDKIMFRNSSDKIQVMSTDRDYSYFKIDSGKIAASGNIMFLMDKTGELKDLSGKNDCYTNMFWCCSKLTKAPELPATTLAERCYYGMFEDCTSLATAPALPATTLANSCYCHTFYNCTNIPGPKYNMSHMTFDEVANEIQNNSILGEYGTDEICEIQCSDAIIVATFDWDTMKWILSEK